MKQEVSQLQEIRLPRVDDYEAIRRMHSRVWRATYPNETEGISNEWVIAETERWLTPESLAQTKASFQEIVTHPEKHFYRVVEQHGKPMGFLHATCESGRYHLDGLYIDPALHGSGVAHRLMAQLNNWVGNHDISLEVVTYNLRAIRFYEKHGFTMENEDNKLFLGELPNRTMIRKGVKS